MEDEVTRDPAEPASPPDQTTATDQDNDDDLIKRLEKISDEIKIRDDDESARQRTADSKLTSALAVLPIILALSTTAFVQLLPYAARLGGFGSLLMVAFVAAIVLFVAAAIKAIIGLWPMRAKYAAIGMRTVSAFGDMGRYPDLLRVLVEERRKVVRNNSTVNSSKLGDYADAALLTVVGLVVVMLIVVALLGAFLVNRDALVKDTIAQPVSLPSAPSNPKSLLAQSIIPWLASHSSAIATPSRWSIAATVIFALLGVAAQLYGGSLVRGGSPNAFDSPPPEGSSDERIHWMLTVFEKQLVSDAGSTMNNVGTLFAVTAVIASIAIGFPDLWPVGILATAVFFLFPFFALWYGGRQMTAKRGRMQNIFDGLPATDPSANAWAMGRGGTPIRSARDYWLDRHPSFGRWRWATVWQRIPLLLVQISESARMYFPRESA
jgi:hypothetical protein